MEGRGGKGPDTKGSEGGGFGGFGEKMLALLLFWDLLGSGGIGQC